MEEIQPMCDRVSNLIHHIPPQHIATTADTRRQRIIGSTITQDTLYGRRVIFEKTIDSMLTTATNHQEILLVVPIVGPGGIGKTTFAQHLYNDERVESHFDVRVWVCVSTDFDVLKLSQQILSSIQRSNTSNQTDNLDELQISIRQELKSKRFLIVFDDIWECNSGGWENLLAPFRKGEAKGSMVVVTTRFPSNAEMVKSTDPIALHGLEFDEFFAFFKALIFEGNKPENYQEDFDDLAKDIANKLKGSPLAAKTVGRLLRKDISREHWMGVLKNNEWQKQKNSDDIMPSLRISYDYLPFHLKKYFLYFSLFPEDFKFSDLDITYLWIALGNIEKDDNYMEELVNNGFLMKEVTYYKEPYYVMHDLLHELSRIVSSQECLNICSSSFRVDAIPQTVRHLSITMKDIIEENFSREMVKLRSKIDIRNLRALMIFRDYEETIDGVMKDFFKEIEGLRVLYIVVKSPQSLSLDFSKLIHLRYINFTKHPSFCFPACRPEMTLPNTLSRLYHLKFLDLRAMNFNFKLPNDISRLINLRHLSVAKELHSNVPWVGKMKCLQELKEFCVQKESVGFEIRELGELTELGGHLSIHNLEKVATKEEASGAKLACKRDLKGLQLFWSTNHQHSTESDVLDALEPHPNLVALSITNHGGTVCPSWLSGDISIKMLGSLRLEGVSWGTFPPFWQLLHLTSLTLINISLLREIRHGFAGVTDKSFVQLKQIVLDCLPNFFQWVGGANAQSFSRLESIQCTSCPNLCAVPFLEHYVSDINMLSIVIKDCPKLSLPPMPHTSALASCFVELGSTHLSYSSRGGLDIKGYSGALAFHNLHKVVQMSITDVSHIPSTELHNLKSLTSLHVKRANITCHGLQDLTRLQSLSINDCTNFFRWPIEAAQAIKLFPASLVSLHISGGSRMQSMALLSNLTYLTKLQSLIVNDCPNFFRWPIEAAHTIKPFPASLVGLQINGESGMQSLTLLSNLTRLRRLILVNCENLKLDGFNPYITVNLKDLAVYNGGNCLSRSVSADLFSQLAVARTNLSLPVDSLQLEVLEVDCISAVLVAPICSLLSATLTDLTFRDDQRAESLTEEEDKALQLLTSLSVINFDDCPNLPSLPEGLHSLPSLNHLGFGGCPQIRSLPKRPLPTSLKSLHIQSCSSELQEQVEKFEATHPDVNVEFC